MSLGILSDFVVELTLEFDSTIPGFSSLGTLMASQGWNQGGVTCREVFRDETLW
jgi:hypothetical protein